MNKVILLTFSLIISTHLWSQTGPGGIGSTDGTSSLVLWLDANTISGTSGSVITSWSDGSGNGYDFAVGNGAVFNNPSVNGYPAFNFNGSSHYFERAFTSGITPSSFTVFTSTNVTSSGIHKAVISNRDDPAGTATAGFILYSVPSSNDWQFWTGRASGAWQITSGGISTAGNWACQMLDYQDVANGKELSSNGSVTGISTHSMTSNPSRPCRIGAGQNESSPNFYFNGDIGEVIMYNTIINTAQKVIINNYMSAKYNYTLTANDFYNEDDAINGNYDHDVAGIGRMDAANIHDDSQGTGIVRILNPTGLGDTEFLFWGHDNNLLQAGETIDVPSPIVARFERVWRVSEVNTSNTAINVGDVDIRFDLTGLGAITASDLRLLIDTDNDGDFDDETVVGGGIVSGAVSLGGNVYEFAGVTDIADNLRFTLGSINISQTPLPIELIDFNALLHSDNTVKLDWQTASEINNDYFTIERSQNGTDWEELTSVNGAGNSSSLLSYQSTDKRPYSGISYYRLKQTDFDGVFEYSRIRSVNITSQVNSGIKIYPNPTNSEITIVANILELEEIKIFNTLGQDISIFTTIKEVSEGLTIIDLSSLSSGIYYVKTKTTANKVYKQ